MGTIDSKDIVPDRDAQENSGDVDEQAADEQGQHEIIAGLPEMEVVEVAPAESAESRLNSLEPNLPIVAALPAAGNAPELNLDRHREPMEVGNNRAEPVTNHAGGMVFKVCDMIRLRRYIVIGNEHGTYYADAKEVAREDITCIQSLLRRGDGEAVVKLLKEYSVAGRCAKEDQLLTCLAICATCEHVKVRQAAYRSLVEICRIPTQLFLFINSCQAIFDQRKGKQIEDQSKKNEHQVKKSEVKQTDGATKTTKKKKSKKKHLVGARKSLGWGRLRRHGISKWYQDKTPERLAVLVTKYKSRHSWSHKELLAFAHPRINASDPAKQAKDLVLKYVVKGFPKVDTLFVNGGADCTDAMKSIFDYLKTLETILKMRPGEEKALIQLMEIYQGRQDGLQIVREHLPTEMMSSVMVWRALLKDMPMTALIRNLGRMSALGMFTDGSADESRALVLNALRDQNRLTKARIHPITILVALRQYQSGAGGEHSDSKWTPDNSICTALDDAFYMAFKNVEPTNLRYLLALDVSGSMGFRGCFGCPTLTPAMAAAAMLLVTKKKEPHCRVLAFSDKLIPIEERLAKAQNINDVMRITSQISFGATDCAQPMIYALEKKLLVDVFIVYTDSETWKGKVSPHTALLDYRKTMNMNAKLIVCAMQTNSFTIADPTDPGMLDMAGFDTAVPEIIRMFSTGVLSSCPCRECNAGQEENA